MLISYGHNFILYMTRNVILCYGEFCVFFILIPSNLITTLTYILMDNFCPCIVNDMDIQLFLEFNKIFGNCGLSLKARSKKIFVYELKCQLQLTYYSTTYLWIFVIYIFFTYRLHWVMQVNQLSNRSSEIWKYRCIISNHILIFKPCFNENGENVKF